MTDVRLSNGHRDHKERFSGCGVLVGERLVLTAHHVLRGGPADDLLVELPNRHRAEVRAVEDDERLDAALLTIGEPVRHWARLGIAEPGVGWMVSTRPRDNDPQLAGVVSAVDREVVTARGHSVTRLQLEVTQQLDEYGGYSGSAVRLGSDPAVVIGLLCEQVRTRLTTVGGGRPRAANVLYAVPTPELASRFGLTSPGPTHEALWRRVANLIAANDFAAADNELARLPADLEASATYWLWRGRVAMARQNFDVAIAYFERALRGDSQHPASLAAMIRALLLRNDPEDRQAAQRLASSSLGISDPLDRWLRCLGSESIFDSGIRSVTQIERLCPYPDDEG